MTCVSGSTRSWPRRVKASTTSSSISVTTPRAPRLIRAAARRSSSGPSQCTCPGAVDQAQGPDLGGEVAEGRTGAVGAGRRRARQGLAVDVAEVLEGQAVGAAAASASAPSRIPAPTRTRQASRSTRSRRSQADRSSITSSVTASGVNECPEPTGRTGRPSAAACCTAAATPGVLTGCSMRAGSHRSSPDQFRHDMPTLRAAGTLPLWVGAADLRGRGPEVGLPASSSRSHSARLRAVVSGSSARSTGSTPGRRGVVAVRRHGRRRSQRPRRRRRAPVASWRTTTIASSATPMTSTVRHGITGRGSRRRPRSRAASAGARRRVRRTGRRRSRIVRREGLRRLDGFDRERFGPVRGQLPARRAPHRRRWRPPPARRWSARCRRGSPGPPPCRRSVVGILGQQHLDQTGEARSGCRRGARRGRRTAGGPSAARRGWRRARRGRSGVGGQPAATFGAR
jgi:hypothetical protein